MLGRVNRQTAPACANFEEMIAWPQIELAADAIELFEGGIAKRRAARVR